MNCLLSFLSGPSQPVHGRSKCRSEHRPEEEARPDEVSGLRLGCVRRLRQAYSELLARPVAGTEENGSNEGSAYILHVPIVSR